VHLDGVLPQNTDKAEEEVKRVNHHISEGDVDEGGFMILLLKMLDVPILRGFDFFPHSFAGCGAVRFGCGHPSAGHWQVSGLASCSADGACARSRISSKVRRFLLVKRTVLISACLWVCVRNL
jgi:hypothetical protein